MLCLIYAHDAHGSAAPKGECVYIRQSTSACVITNIYHFKHSEKLPTPEAKLLNSIYSVGCRF